jgi:hypothetical protein
VKRDDERFVDRHRQARQVREAARGPAEQLRRAPGQTHAAQAGVRGRGGAGVGRQLTGDRDPAEEVAAVRRPLTQADAGAARVAELERDVDEQMEEMLGLGGEMADERTNGVVLARGIERPPRAASELVRDEYVVERRRHHRFLRGNARCARVRSEYVARANFQHAPGGAPWRICNDLPNR